MRRENKVGKKLLWQWTKWLDDIDSKSGITAQITAAQEGTRSGRARQSKKQIRPTQNIEQRSIRVYTHPHKQHSPPTTMRALSVRPAILTHYFYECPDHLHLSNAVSVVRKKSLPDQVNQPIQSNQTRFGLMSRIN